MDAHGASALPAPVPLGPTEADGPATSGIGDFVHLFERARRALTSRLQLEPGIAEALALPRSDESGMAAAGPAGARAQGGRRVAPARLAAELAIDDRTRRLVVRVVDVQTRMTVRELPAAALAAVAAKLGRIIPAGKR